MYLSRLKIKGFRGIVSCSFDFKSGVNVLIGENASNKSAVIDALRLLYCLGDPQRDIWVKDEDFNVNLETNTKVEKISIEYEFSDMSVKQKGALYEYLILGKTESEDLCKFTLEYQQRKDGSIITEYFSGTDPEQKPGGDTFSIFQHYYLDALRDSTHMLLNNKKNILGKLLSRTISRSGSENEFQTIINTANKGLLARNEISQTRHNINENLRGIFKRVESSNVGLRIDSSRIDYIMNTIKPYLPHNLAIEDSPGFQIGQNSLGFNNLIYFAVVLGDIRERKKIEKLYHFALLIEEPEVHLHPQLQLNLYRFLEDNLSGNTQLFLTTHSPTLTSKVPLSSLNLIAKNCVWNMENCFLDRSSENIKKDGTNLTDANFKTEKNKVERYIDVTRSQMFFSKAIIFVEGISEEMLVHKLCKKLGFELEDFQIELVNVNGVSFYPFIHFFNSSSASKRLPQPILILTDDDRYPNSKNKKYSFNKLISKEEILDNLVSKIESGAASKRISNLHDISNGQLIDIKTSYQTFELDLAYSNVFPKQDIFYKNALINYLKDYHNNKFEKIKKYVDKLFTVKTILDQSERKKIALLLWKCIKTKANFAQEFSIYLENSTLMFVVPRYIRRGLKRLVNSI
ncbi:MAG: AAA family ATPase [Candidatus Shapirobacteria bacterium]|nr:AAA family ATPase [Candidatus Shapirobacteria bacterium]